MPDIYRNPTPAAQPLPLYATPENLPTNGMLAKFQLHAGHMIVGMTTDKKTVFCRTVDSAGRLDLRQEQFPLMLNPTETILELDTALSNHYSGHPDDMLDMAGIYLVTLTFEKVSTEDLDRLRRDSIVQQAASKLSVEELRALKHHFLSEEERK